MELPEGYKNEDNVIWGKKKSHPGLLEVIIYNPKKRNAIGSPPEKKLTEIFLSAD